MGIEQVICHACDKQNPSHLLICQYCGELLDVTIIPADTIRSRLLAELQAKIEHVKEEADKPLDVEASVSEEISTTDNAESVSDNVLSTENISVKGDDDSLQPFGRVNTDDYISLRDQYSGFEYRIKLEASLQEITLGRPDRKTGYEPTIDLTRIDGHKKGVSRFHAVIVKYDNYLGLTDHSSTNGTFLNGIRLISGQTRIIRDGDIIQLSDVKLTLQYK